jgi:hypothetical protein
VFKNIVLVNFINTLKKIKKKIIFDINTLKQYKNIKIQILQEYNLNRVPKQTLNLP